MQRKNYDTVSIESVPGELKAQRRTVNTVFGAWLGARMLPRRSFHKLSLEAARGRGPLLRSGGLGFDRCPSE
jgi:hypothetical protein